MYNYTRLQSLLYSFQKNGVIKTFKLLFQLLLIKVNAKEALKVNGQKVYLRNHTSDVPVFRQIFLDNEYDLGLREEPKYIIDLGANIGLASFYFKQRYKHSKVIAVELDKGNFSQMQKNLQGFEDVHLINAAIWPKEGFLTITRNNELGEWGITASEIDNDQSYGEKVQSITLNQIMEKYKLPYIDLLKIDIEGGESQLFTNVSWLGRVKYTVIELHDRIYPASSNNFFKTLSQLERFNIEMKGEKVVIENLAIID